MASQRILNRRGDCARRRIFSPHKRTHYLCFDLLTEHTGCKGENRQQKNAATFPHGPLHELRDALPTLSCHLCSFCSRNTVQPTGKITSTCCFFFVRATKLHKEGITARAQNALRGIFLGELIQC